MTEAAEAVETAETETDDIAQSPPVEDEARRLGWRPKDEFKGDESKWIDAETFVAKGREILPIVQANNKALEKKVAEMEKTMAEAREFFSKSEKRAYEAALKDIEARMDAAVDAGDVATARAITKEATELAAEMKAAPKPDAPKANPVFDSWMEENPWFNVDDDLTAYARGLSFPAGTPDDEQLKLIAAKVKKAFPHKFENARRAQPAAVEGAANGSRKAAKGWADLPPEARAQADRFIKSGFVKDRDAYVKDYQW